MTHPLPFILAGPILRHVSVDTVCFWIATSEPCNITLDLFDGSTHLLHKELNNQEKQQCHLGTHCYLQLVEVKPDTPLPTERSLEYQLHFDGERTLTDLLPDIIYAGNQRPNFVVPRQLNNLLHGSCRKPHHPSQDAFLEVDRILADAQNRISDRPDLLMLTGDQIYADDVAGPMLYAIRQVIHALGLLDETFTGATVNNTQELYADPNTFYNRMALLPRCKSNRPLIELFFGGAEKPIFTSVGAHNHLISLAEVIAMYLLSWSPECWSLVDFSTPPNGLSEKSLQRYNRELPVIQDFAANLVEVRRALAHLPTYMIFDDHDITDDWNLTRGWEEAAYEHPFSRRIIGNALVGYTLCQGWGNAPDKFRDILNKLRDSLTGDESQRHDELIRTLLDFEQWHYEIPTQPPMIVLDTRTQRWRSERSANKPSGLMDWEALTDLQQKLLTLEKVILVSPSPIFGVKFIEMVQRVFTFFGNALMVDAENWMAHPGAANAILNVFRHRNTPQHFVILSGDVHYSFAYDVTLRLRKNSPRILQISASGIKNTFPEKLLIIFDYFNRVLYSAWSPLNWFTKRKRMKVQHRLPNQQQGRTLLNQSGIGQVILAANVEDIQVRIRQHGETITFEPEEPNPLEKLSADNLGR